MFVYVLSVCVKFQNSDAVLKSSIKHGFWKTNYPETLVVENTDIGSSAK